jgi:hypothetical protein
MPFNAANWANPNQFSDISVYSGLDEKQGMTSVTDIMKKATLGIEPPPSGSSEQSFGQQVMGAVAPNFQKYSSAAGQIGQGNFSGAANTMGVKAPTLGVPKLPALGQPTDTGMSHQFED